LPNLYLIDPNILNFLTNLNEEILMKKTLLIVAASTLSLSISSVLSAGEIETAQRYSASLEQNVVEMDVSAIETGPEVALSELDANLSLGSNAEIQELGSDTYEYLEFDMYVESAEEDSCVDVGWALACDFAGLSYDNGRTFHAW
jgi:hypothetical protein